MHNSRRTAGLALLVTTLGTFGAFTLTGAPAGNYDAHAVTTYISDSHRASAFIGGFLGLISAVALLVFATAVRAELPDARSRDLVWGAGIAAAATAAIGWVFAAGIPIAFAEGGGHVAPSSSTIYLLSVLGVLMIYGPAGFFTGIAVLILARRLVGLPRWARAFTYLAGVCAILGVAYFPYYLYELWAVVAGIWGLTARDRRRAPQPLTADPVSA